MTREEGVELRLIGRNDPQESLSPHTPSSPESNPNWKTLSYLAGSIIYVAIFTLMGSLLRDLPGWWMASIIAPISLPGILFMIKGKRTFLFHQEEAHADPRFITLHRLRLFFISVFLLAPICGGLLPSYLLNKEYASSGQSPLITNLISVAQLSNTSISTGFYRFQQIHLEVQYSKKGSYGSVQKKTFCLAPVSPSPGFVNATKIVYVWGIISPSQSCDNSHALFDAFPGGYLIVNGNFPDHVFENTAGEITQEYGLDTRTQDGYLFLEYENPILHFKRVARACILSFAIVVPVVICALAACALKPFERWSCIRGHD